MKIENFKRNQKVQLAIPSSRPIKTLKGVLHEAGQDYKVLGTHGTCVRLSRVIDCEKLIVTPDMILA